MLSIYPFTQKKDHAQFELYQAIREELGNLREFNEAGQIENPLPDEMLARALAKRLFNKHGFRKGE